MRREDDMKRMRGIKGGKDKIQDGSLCEFQFREQFSWMLLCSNWIDCKNIEETGDWLKGLPSDICIIRKGGKEDDDWNPPRVFWLLSLFSSPPLPSPFPFLFPLFSFFVPNIIPKDFTQKKCDLTRGFSRLFTEIKKRRQKERMRRDRLVDGMDAVI